jgi:hypothetical protein
MHPFSRFYDFFNNMDANRSTTFRIIQVRMVLFLSVGIHEGVELSLVFYIGVS